MKNELRIFVPSRYDMRGQLFNAFLFSHDGILKLMMFSFLERFFIQQN